nr:hypothetical protein Itr_chr06CG12340 [Ipomoea trifida]
MNLCTNEGEVRLASTSSAFISTCSAFKCLRSGRVVLALAHQSDWLVELLVGNLLGCGQDELDKLHILFILRTQFREGRTMRMLEDVDIDEPVIRELYESFSCKPHDLHG